MSSYQEKCLVCLENDEGEALLNLHGKGHEMGHFAHWSCWMEYLRRTNQKCLPVCPLCFTYISIGIVKKTIKMSAQNRGIVSYLRCCVRRNNVELAIAAIEEYQDDIWDADWVLKVLEERMAKEKLAFGAMVTNYKPLVKVLVESLKWTADGLDSAVKCSVISDSVLLTKYLVTTFHYSNWKLALDTAKEFGSRQCHFFLAQLAGQGTLDTINVNYLSMCKTAMKQKKTSAKALKGREEEIRAALKDRTLRARLREKYPDLPFVVEKPSLARRLLWKLQGVKYK